MPFPWTVGTGSIVRVRPGRIPIQRIYTSYARPILISSISHRRVHNEASKPSLPGSILSETSNEPEAKSEVRESRDEKKDASPSFAMTLDAFRTRLTERANELTSNARLSLSELGGRVNQITGYEHIERLKHKVVQTGKTSLILHCLRAEVYFVRGGYCHEETSGPRC